MSRASFSSGMSDLSTSSFGISPDGRSLIQSRAKLTAMSGWPALAMRSRISPAACHRYAVQLPRMTAITPAPMT